MGFCSCLGDTFKKTFGTIFNAAKVLGSAVCRCLGHCCMCSDCLPSSETVGIYVGRFLTFVFLAVCCPCFCCWCFCKAIILFRRKKRDQDPEDRPRNGYNTFDNDSEQQTGYEERGNAAKQQKNYLFYTNQLESEPRGALIEDILTEWHGRYDLLENHHGFIQWLFPLYERGVNYSASPLNAEERQMILDDPETHQRMRRACWLMLDFYGVGYDELTGQLSRNANYKDRFRNLNINSHNNLRITRIIKCLVIFNHRDLAKSIIKFFVTEMFKEGNLPGCRRSCESFWITSLHPGDVVEMQIYCKQLEKEADDMRHSDEPDLLIDDDDDDDDDAN